MQNKTLNPYIAGVLVGILLVLSVIVAGKYLGASTTFSRGASVIEKTLGIDYSKFEYFTTKKGNTGLILFRTGSLCMLLGLRLALLLVLYCRATLKCNLFRTCGKINSVQVQLKEELLRLQEEQSVLSARDLPGDVLPDTDSAGYPSWP